MVEAAQVHIVDDDPAIRESLLFLLESAGLSARSYASAAEFLEIAADLPSGCVLTDVRMPGMDGLTLQQRLRERGVALPLIVMTGHGEVAMAVQALKAGASDFLEKPFDDERLLTVVRAALQASEEARRRRADERAIRDRMASLTPREAEVLERLVAGLPNKTIAHELGSSPRTVEVQRARVMDKMGARSLPELVRMVLSVRDPSAGD